MKYLYFLFLVINAFYCYSYMNIYSFSYKELITKAKLCKICYSKNAVFNIQKNQMLKHYDNYIFINETKTKSLCYIFYNKHQIDVSFKGTTNINDICTNINIYPAQFFNNDNNNIRIHNGFLHKYLLLKPHIINNIDKIIANNSIKEICLSGHSSGGAVANIASFDLCNLYKNKIIKCVTFGSPSVGNHHFNNIYNKKVNVSLRIINNNDIIQYLPLKIFYENIHEPLILQNHKKLTFYDFLLNIYGYYKHNHHIKTYIKNLKQLYD